MKISNKFTLEKVFLLVGSGLTAVFYIFWTLIMFVMKMMPETADADLVQSIYGTIYPILSLLGIVFVIAIFILAFFINSAPKVVASLSILFITIAAILNFPTLSIMLPFIGYIFILIACIRVFSKLIKPVPTPVTPTEINQAPMSDFTTTFTA